MAKYNKETKFYWLQLKEDFFEDDSIQWLEDQKPNGRDYAYFYLKLCLKALKSNGVLIRKVGNILVPYDNKKLAELTKIDFDTVTIAMELLKKIGLIEILETGEIYIKQLENLIGSKSIGAFKKQQQRLIGGQEVDNCPPKIELELKIDIELDKDIELEKNNIYFDVLDYYQNKIKTISNENELNILNDNIHEFGIYVLKHAIDLCFINKKSNFKYLQGILRNYRINKIKTLVDVKKMELTYKSKVKGKEIKKYTDEWWEKLGCDYND